MDWGGRWWIFSFHRTTAERSPELSSSSTRINRVLHQGHFSRQTNPVTQTEVRSLRHLSRRKRPSVDNVDRLSSRKRADNEEGEVDKRTAVSRALRAEKQKPIPSSFHSYPKLRRRRRRQYEKLISSRRSQSRALLSGDRKQEQHKSGGGGGQEGEGGQGRLNKSQQPQTLSEESVTSERKSSKK